MTVCFR